MKKESQEGGRFMEKMPVGAPLNEETSLPSRIYREVMEAIDENRGQSGAIIRVLQRSQELIGYLPAVVLKTISQEMRIPLSEIYGITSFYHFFSMVPKGRHIIQACMGTSCYVKGGQKILDTLKKEYKLTPGDVTVDGRFSLETVRCLGCCGLSPVIAVSGNVHRRVKYTELKDLLSTYK
jgi:NADH:ubiquinone oxidoreductase subunit E